MERSTLHERASSPSGELLLLSIGAYRLSLRAHCCYQLLLLLLLLSGGSGAPIYIVLVRQHDRVQWANSAFRTNKRVAPPATPPSPSDANDGNWALVWLPPRQF